MDTANIRKFGKTASAASASVTEWVEKLGGSKLSRKIRWILWLECVPVFVLVHFDIDSKERDIMGSHLGLSGGNRRETAGILPIGWKLAFMQILRRFAIIFFCF